MSIEHYNEVDGMDIITTLRSVVVALHKETENMQALGRKMCEYSRDYEIAKAQKIFEFTDRGMPVTLIKEVCNGKISDEVYNKDLSKVLYDVSKARVRSLEAEMSAMQTLYRAEYKGM